MNNHINNVGEQLEEAFNMFNQFSEKLSVSYGDLEVHVAKLTKELEQEREERLVQLAQKEMLTKKLEGLFDVLPAGIVVLDSEGCISQTNRVAQEMLAVKEDNECIGKKWLSVAADTFITEDDELKLVDGRWVNLSACPLSDDPGKIMLITDVTEIHALHKMLDRQRRLCSLGEMIASLAHQIRTPLSSALLYMTASIHPATDTRKNHHLVSKAKERMHYLERMVDDMLMFSRGDVSSAEFIKVDEIFNQFKTSTVFDYSMASLQVNVDDKLKDITIKANSDVLSGALQNIVDNAVDACNNCVDHLQNKEKRIVISVSLNPENQVEISVKDNGCGMTDKVKDRIMEPFFTTRTGGTGLGLAVVSTTVRRYGGKITIESKQGIGSEFRITFPPTELNGMLPGNVTSADKGILNKKIRTENIIKEDQKSRVEEQEVL